MKATVVRNGEMFWDDVPTPSPGPGEVRIKVAATACNRADLLQRRGLYPPPEGATEILGLDASGVIDAIGENVDQWDVGDPVCALLAGGGYAEYVVTPASVVLPVPDRVRLIDAAAIPEVFFTAYVNLFVEGELKTSESALIHAAASGVGTAAVQLCKARGITVYGTASGQKLDFLERLGIDAAIDRNEEDFSARVADLTEHQGVDLILDPVGGDYLSRNLHLLADQGRLVIIGLLGGAEGELPLGRLLRKRLKIIGSVLRSRSLEEKARLTAAVRKDLWPLFADGSVQPIIDQRLPIQEANHAHELLRKNQTIGKVLLVVDDSL